MSSERAQSSDSDSDALAIETPELDRVLQAGGTHGGGNQLYLYRTANGPRLLKVYVGRNALWKQWLKTVSHRFFERKRGVFAHARCETERQSLELWRREGFDVPRIYSDPVPAEHAQHPCLWLEYCEGPSIADLLEDPHTTDDVRRDLVRRYARTLAPRHRLAIARNQPLLVPEHASVKHCLVHRDRLVTFDLEGGFRAGFAVREALSQEVASLLRSIARKAEPLFDELFAIFIESYGDSDLLLEIADHGLDSVHPYRVFKRRQDAKRRPRFSKTGMLRRIRETLRD